jgi:hypothetical protein
MPNLTLNSFAEEVEQWKADLEKLELKSNQPMVFKDDPVAMAWASYRRWKDGDSRWIDLEEVTVTEEDRAKSTEIRRYYADRILITMLKNKQVSEFRRKLYGVVTNSMQLNKSDVGLLHRLPYFYEEDLAVDRVVERTQGLTERTETDRIQAQFTVLERVFKSRRSGEYTQFWMQSNSHSAPFAMVVKHDNPYYRLVNAIMSRPVTLSGWAQTKFHAGHHRGLGYYYLANIEVVDA